MLRAVLLWLLGAVLIGLSYTVGGALRFVLAVAGDVAFAASLYLVWRRR